MLPRNVSQSPKLILPSPCVPQFPCFPYSPVPIFPSPYFSQSLCSPVYLFPSPYRCSPVPMLPSLYVLPTNSPVHKFLTPIPQRCFPFPKFPKHVPQSPCSPMPMFPKTCSPVPMFPQLVPQSLCSPVLFHRSVFHPLYSPHMIPSSYVPQTCSPVPMFPSPHVSPTSCLWNLVDRSKSESTWKKDNMTVVTTPFDSSPVDNIYISQCDWRWARPYKLWINV